MKLLHEHRLNHTMIVLVDEVDDEGDEYAVAELKPEVAIWCRMNCKGIWEFKFESGYELDMRRTNSVIRFSNLTDAVYFKLSWSEGILPNRQSSST